MIQVNIVTVSTDKLAVRSSYHCSIEMCYDRRDDVTISSELSYGTYGTYYATRPIMDWGRVGVDVRAVLCLPIVLRRRPPPRMGWRG